MTSRMRLILTPNVQMSRTTTYDLNICNLDSRIDGKHSAIHSRQLRVTLSRVPENYWGVPVLNSHAPLRNYWALWEVPAFPLWRCMNIISEAQCASPKLRLRQQKQNSLEHLFPVVDAISSQRSTSNGNAKTVSERLSRFPINRHGHTAFFLRRVHPSAFPSCIYLGK